MNGIPSYKVLFPVNVDNYGHTQLDDLVRELKSEFPTSEIIGAKDD